MINSIKWQLIRDSILNREVDNQLIREIIRGYYKKEIKHSKSKYSLVDMYNKTYQLNAKGLVEYIETKLAKKHLAAVLEYFVTSASQI